MSRKKEYYKIDRFTSFDTIVSSDEDLLEALRKSDDVLTYISKTNGSRIYAMSQYIRYVDYKFHVYTTYGMSITHRWRDNGGTETNDLTTK